MYVASHVIIITSFHCPFVLVSEKILKVPFLIKFTPKKKEILSKIQVIAMFIYSAMDFFYGSPKIAFLPQIFKMGNQKE